MQGCLKQVCVVSKILLYTHVSINVACQSNVSPASYRAQGSCHLIPQQCKVLIQLRRRL